ncbi:steroidogenic acute regulatory protein-like isoform X2 [Limulus polyphemus]|uniref:Steroidogenic acute regulatory protein-like isoform X2 n=1 Tax=Limulus polyphemus TaxID=6850 RepID=A0ABM1SBM0_LIMPO|nr:steroidogenic acute regulatory protein-like isoform X2 [Limulus polyphemus]
MGNSKSKSQLSEQYLSAPMSASRSFAITPYYGSVNSVAGSELLDNIALREGSSFSGHVSPVRRFFLLLTTFDFVFNVLLWLICGMLTGEGVENAFKKEVMNYSFEKSLFDIVMASAWRFTLILLAYGLFRISHWWMIAWDASNQSQTPYSAVVVLLIASFVMSWVEAWFLDFRVVPSEEKASVLLARCVNEHTPFIPPYGSVPRAFSEDGTFYSPPGSTVGDLEEEEVVEECEAEPPCIPFTELTPQEVEYKTKVEEAIKEALEIITTGNWRTEKLIDEDIIQSREISKYGKIFKFVGKIKITPQKVVEELFYNIENVPNWNPTTKTIKVLQKIDNQTDIIYIVADGVGGIITSRDFVAVRMLQYRGGSIINGMVSITHPAMPPQAKYVRGEQGPSVYVFTPVDGSNNRCHLQWLSNTNLKGWLPQYLIDQTMASVMLDYIKHLRSFAKNLNVTNNGEE